MEQKIKVYILFDTDSQEAIKATLLESEMATAVSDYGDLTQLLELRIYEEAKLNGELELAERIPSPVWLDGMFVTKTCYGKAPEEEDEE